MLSLFCRVSGVLGDVRLGDGNWMKVMFGIVVGLKLVFFDVIVGSVVYVVSVVSVVRFVVFIYC